MNRRDALKALVSLPAIRTIAVAQVKPGDVIVIEIDAPVSDETKARIRTRLAEIWPHQKSIVMDSGAKLRIARSVE